jgi:hypothetical protein
MAYPGSRSTNDELDAGATDGKYRKVIMDRGGVVEHTFTDDRECLTGAFYGIHEASRMRVPGGDRSCRNPYSIHLPEPEIPYF